MTVDISHSEDGRLAAKVNRSDANHAQSDQSAGSRSDHERTVQRNDEGLYWHLGLVYQLICVLSVIWFQAGIIEEMLDDTMETVMDDPEDMEEEAQSEIDNVQFKTDKLK